MEQSFSDRSRIARLEQIVHDHDSRMQFLEGLMDRVMALNEIVVQLLQRQAGDDAHNGQEEE